jgi:hypothetical protein
MTEGDRYTWRENSYTPFFATDSRRGQGSNTRTVAVTIAVWQNVGVNFWVEGRVPRSVASVTIPESGINGR